MFLYLVRHGDALPGEVDAERPLSKKGIEDTKKIAEFLKDIDIKVEAIFHSGLKRAKQTAEIIAMSLGRSSLIVQRNSLGPEDSVVPICEDLAQRTHDGMIVGHLPFLSHLVSYLILGSEEKEIIDFKKGAVIALERDQNHTWKIRWFMIPKLL